MDSKPKSQYSRKRSAFNKPIGLRKKSREAKNFAAIRFDWVVFTFRSFSWGLPIRRILQRSGNPN